MKIKKGWLAVGISLLAFGFFSCQGSEASKEEPLGVEKPQISVEAVIPETTDANGPYNVVVKITDDYEIASACLFYRVGEGDFIDICSASRDGDLYIFEIPGPQAVGSIIRYYLEATDNLGNVTLDPEGAPGDCYNFAWLFHTSIITGEEAGDNLGYRLNSAGNVLDAGDLNGDGFNELVMAANYTCCEDYGRVYIFYGDGSAFPSTSAVNADTALWGEFSGDGFGIPVAIMRDLNEDGLNDLAIGAVHSDVGSHSAGSIYIWYGIEGYIPDGPATTADMIIRGVDSESIGAMSGGDLNGDGVNDLVIGGRWNNTAGKVAGAVYIFYGPIATGEFSTNQADVAIYGKEDHEYLGLGVRVADVNSDGIEDLIAGAPELMPEKPGRAYIIYGTTIGIPGGPITQVADVELIGAELDSRFGVPVDSADLNGDGINDVIIGAQWENSQTGAVYIFHGSTTGIASGAATTANTILTGEATGDRFGRSLDADGDINGDRIADLIVSSPYNDAEGSNAGAVYIFYGDLSGISSKGADSSDIVLWGEAAGDEFGHSAVGVGDTNQDFLNDIAIGAPKNDNIGGEDAGAVYVFY